MDVNPQGRLIGMYNGKKLYEVTVTGDMSGFTKANTVENVSKPHGVPNINSVVGVVSAKYGMWMGPYLEDGAVATTIGQITASNIIFRNKANWGSSYTWIVTFQYTLKE